jgi:4,5-dihydroxyphthalate decarboxylase
MAPLRLSLACWNYDRTRGLMDGRIPVDGVELTYLNLPVEETFFRMLRHQEFDVAEMSLSSYTMSLFADHPPFIAIPVFPSRYFRHSCIYVHSNAGIREAKDLVGKRVGVPEYQITAAVWIRGILADRHGLPVSGPQYLTGGLEEVGRPEKIKLALPPEIRVQAIPPTKTLSQMLSVGEIDALYTARMPSTFLGDHDGQRSTVARLYPDYDAVEREYFSATRIFPIMHTIILKQDVYQKNRWVVQSLCKAFAAAQREAYEQLRDTTALKTMLPWLTRHLEDTERLLGPDFWPYGLEANQNTLDTFLRYHFEQGLSKRLLTAKELFAPESLESFKI